MPFRPSNRTAYTAASAPMPAIARANTAESGSRARSNEPNGTLHGQRMRRPGAAQQNVEGATNVSAPPTTTPSTPLAEAQRALRPRTSASSPVSNKTATAIRIGSMRDKSTRCFKL